ncbi:hypothetical protein ACOSP7_012941 [Xanthoceras sorbifolium]
MIYIYIYDRIRSDILRIEPFLNPKSAFATVRGEEQCHKIMLDRRSSSHVAMVAKNYGPHLTQNEFIRFPVLLNEVALIVAIVSIQLTIALRRMDIQIGGIALLNASLVKDVIIVTRNKVTSRMEERCRLW